MSEVKWGGETEEAGLIGVWKERVLVGMLDSMWEAIGSLQFELRVARQNHFSHGTRQAADRGVAGDHQEAATSDTILPTSCELVLGETAESDICLPW